MSHVEVRNDTVETGILRLTISEWIANFGFWEKSKIVDLDPSNSVSSQAQPNNSLKPTGPLERDVRLHLRA